MTKYRCHVLEPTPNVRLFLRRYTEGTVVCPKNGHYHQARVCIETSVPKSSDMFPAEARYKDALSVGDFWDHSDSRWPTACDCGYQFEPSDRWQLFPKQLYQRVDQPESEPITLDEAEPGALWRLPWMEDYKGFRGLDGQSWMCRTPDGDWMIDGPASNCTMKGDVDHKCWCRHGTAPDFHVDKNGHTCAAGAGSIQSGSYHGFLHRGYLTEQPIP